MKWQPVDIIVVVLVAPVVVLPIVIGVQSVVTGDRLSDTQAEILAGIFATALAIISMYVGAMIKRNDE